MSARTIISSTPPERPEILPFSPHPSESIAAYEEAWTHHLALVRSALTS